MIELKLTGMCEGCPYFEPEMLKFFAYAGFPVEQRLCCKHRSICERLENYFRQHPPEGGESA